MTHAALIDVIQSPVSVYLREFPVLPGEIVSRPLQYKVGGVESIEIIRLKRAALS